MGQILEWFVNHECTAFERRLLEDAISHPATPYRHFEFNVFEITIQHGEGIVLIENVLEASASERVPLEDFAAALRRCSK